jgi:mRNA-degrading endonuclease RelE of RelBE toxin-antitoxin system
MAESTVTIVWGDEALKGLRAVGSRTVRQKLALKVDELARTDEPEQLGKPLQDELQGLFRITFGRYRIIYSVRRTTNGIIDVQVQVILVGIRKEGHKTDVYRIAQRLRRGGKI